MLEDGEMAAQVVCDRINRYWIMKGKLANARPELIRAEKKDTGGAFIWAIRSDLVGGLPPK